MTGAREAAAQLDDAIDAILRGEAGPRTVEENELVATARLLHESLPRVAPRRGFEELLAARLAGARRRLTPEAPGEGTPAPLYPAGLTSVAAAEGLADASAVEAIAAERRRRQLVAGGAIASGVSLALPLAGAAIVAWRRSRSSGAPF